MAITNIIQGDTYTGKITVLDNVGDPIDITGWVFYITVKKNINDTDANALLIKDISVLSDPTNGEALFYFLPVDTADLPIGTALIEMKYQTDGGSVKTFQTYKQITITKSLRDSLT